MQEKRRNGILGTEKKGHDVFGANTFGAVGTQATYKWIECWKIRRSLRLKSGNGQTFVPSKGVGFLPRDSREWKFLNRVWHNYVLF